MAFSNYPDKYLRFNEQTVKNLRIVVDIDGLDLITSSAIYTRVRYGDPDINYGDPGLVYGGLRRLDTYQGREVKDILSLDSSSLHISQRLEPEQGRGAVSTMSLAFVDRDNYMTQVISPGVIIDEILGRQCVVYLGFEQISFPDDYITIFRGRISDVKSHPGLVILQLSDPNLIRRQNVFFIAQTKLSTGITNLDTTIDVTSNSDFSLPILGPNGSYDTAIKTFFIIDDEWIEYDATGFGTNQFTSVTRGARGTTAASHTAGADVQAAIQIEDHAIDMALKIMLSGWNGPWKENVPILNIVFTGDPILDDQPRAIILRAFTDAVRDFGLVIGDYVTITGDANPLNNVTGRITRFADLFDQSNRIIYLDVDLYSSISSAAVLSFRSQYDTYPDNCGVRLNNNEVDIEQHLFLKNTFLGQSANSLRFFLQDKETAKTFIESEIYLPMSLYSLTRQGKLSAGITKPPIADQKLIFLNIDNIIEPQNIIPTRGINNRKFFNEITYQFDADDNNNFLQTERYLDTESLSLVGISKELPIKSRGIKTDLGTPALLEKRALFMLSRYKRGATVLPVKVNYDAGSQIEAGDVVAIQDDVNGEATLKITNFATGERNFGVQLMEVVDRDFDIRNGTVNLQLVAGVGADATDRFATISPSSIVGSGSTTSRIRIKDSFGALFPGNESEKWRDYQGQHIVVHNFDQSVYEQVTLTQISPTDNTILEVSPALSFVPVENEHYVNIPAYPDSADRNQEAIYKAIHAFLDPQVIVVSGLSTTQFTVAPSDITKFFVGSRVRVHSFDYSIDSDDKVVTAIDTLTYTVTVGVSLGFTPAAGQQIDLIGFRDASGAYRFI